MDGIEITQAGNIVKFHNVARKDSQIFSVDMIPWTDYYSVMASNSMNRGKIDGENHAKNKAGTDMKERRNVALPVSLHVEVKEEILPMIPKVFNFSTNMEGFVESAIRAHIKTVRTRYEKILAAESKGLKKTG